MKVISLQNYKGGSTKTSSSLNIAKGLANLDFRVLLIDLDAQGNSSSKFIRNYENVPGICEAFSRKTIMPEMIHKTAYENLDIIPSKLEFEDVKDHMQSNSQTTLLKKCLNNLEGYDFVILDNNPSYRIILQNCIYAADLIVIPVCIDQNAIKGVDYTIERINEVIEESIVPLKPNIKILAAKATRTTLSNACLDELNEYYHENMLSTVICNQNKPAQMQTFMKDYFMVDDTETAVGEDYRELVKEILNEFTRKH